MTSGNIKITKCCTCKMKDKNNWVITEPIRGKSTLVKCEKCGCQWRTTAKYVNSLNYANYIKR